MKHDKIQPICDGPGGAFHDPGVTGLALLAFLGEAPVKSEMVQKGAELLGRVPPSRLPARVSRTPR